MPTTNQEGTMDRNPLTQQLFEVICSYMHHTGTLDGVLTPQEQWQVYCKADGFGKCTAAQLRRINGGWDWSHIRDSTDAGVARMYAKLTELLQAKGLEVGQA